MKNCWIKQDPKLIAIAEQVYMLPSDMLLKADNIKGYNNNLLIANESVKIGIINQHINVTPKHVPPVFHKPSADLPKTSPTTTLPAHEKRQAKDHEEDKSVLIIAGIGLILVGFYFM